MMGRIELPWRRWWGKDAGIRRDRDEPRYKGFRADRRFAVFSEKMLMK
jgi:hypothetical protein